MSSRTSHHTTACIQDVLRWRARAALTAAHRPMLEEMPSQRECDLLGQGVHIAPEHMDLPKAAHTRCVIKSVDSRAGVWRVQPGMTVCWHRWVLPQYWGAARWDEGLLYPSLLCLAEKVRVTPCFFRTGGHGDSQALLSHSTLVMQI